MEYSKVYVDTHGHLRVFKGKKPYKFCRYCAQELRGDKEKLIKHFHTHAGEEPTFLRYDQAPIRSKVLNLERYVKGLDQELVMHAEDKKRLKGRPRHLQDTSRLESFSLAESSQHPAVDELDSR